MGAADLTLAEQGLSLSLLLRLPGFSCVVGVAMTFHCLIYISFKNRVRLSNWPIAYMVTASVGMVSTAFVVVVVLAIFF